MVQQPDAANGSHFQLFSALIAGCFTLSGISFCLIGGREGRLIEAHQPHAHGIKVATGPADRSFDLRQNMQLNDDNMSVGVGGGGKVSICHELLSQNFVTDD